MNTTLLLPDRFWDKVAKGGPDDCWLWTGSLTGNGYGRISMGGRLVRAHSLPLAASGVDIPAGMVLDHTCHTRALELGLCAGGVCDHRRCVNPAHVRVTTHGENVLAGDGWTARNSRVTHCPKGHEYTAENTYDSAKGRKCRTCHRALNGMPVECFCGHKTARAHLRLHQQRRHGGATS